MKLSDWAKNNNLTYMQGYRKFQNNQIKDAYKTASGAILIRDEPELPKIASVILNNQQVTGDVKPLMAGWAKEARASSTSTRTNRAAGIEPVGKYQNIENGLIPFNSYAGAQYGGKNISLLNIRDAIILCQKAYYNFAIFRSVIDLMTEFSVADLYYSGGSATSRKFFESLFRKIDLMSFQDVFFREYYRSGNVFTFRFDGLVKPADVAKITQVFGENKKPLDIKAGSSVSLPLKYIVLNPADIQLLNTSSFVTGVYYKILSPFEIEALRNPQTDEDRDIYDSLDPATKKLISQKSSVGILLKLDNDKMVPVFYKKQSYESFAVPMGFPVLSDLNFKEELKKMDLALTRTTQQAILLITMGASPTEGGINQANLVAMQSLFENQSVGRVLIADYTTKGEFLVPPIWELLGPQKYEVINADIQQGLNNILVGNNEKFANQSIKVQIFVERLKKAREAFLNNFLIPEIKRISKELGFKVYPSPNFSDINLRDDIEFSRIVTRLAEIGVLTPQETLTAIDSGRIPTNEESLDAQQSFRDEKDKGFWEPIQGAGFTQLKIANLNADTSIQNAKLGADTTLQKQSMMPKALPKSNGRPSGSKAPQKKKRVRPIGASETRFSLKSVTENMILASKLTEDINNKLLKKHKLKELNADQKDFAQSLTEIIIANEEVGDWKNKIKDYIDNPVDKNPDRIEKVLEIAAHHQLDQYMAAILSHSVKDI